MDIHYNYKIMFMLVICVIFMVGICKINHKQQEKKIKNNYLLFLVLIVWLNKLQKLL